jgi:hypothetical protein
LNPSANKVRFAFGSKKGKTGFGKNLTDEQSGSERCRLK